MKIDAYLIVIILSALVVLSYLFNYLASRLRIPFVLLLLGSGIGLNYAAILVSVIATTVMLRLIFFRFILKINSTPLMLIAPRGLITVLLFYSIPESQRMA